MRGAVRLADGSPARAVTVQAVDRDLRSEEVLGRTRTDDAGAYRIAYSGDQIHKRERGTADLVVRALGSDGALLAASPVMFNAPVDAVVDLTIAAETRVPPTLYEKIAAALPPLIEGVKVTELEEYQDFQDLTFLAGETGFAKGDLARFVMAQMLVGLGVQAEFWFALLGGPRFPYAEGQSLKAQFASITDALPALDADSVHKAIVRGFESRDISLELRGRTEEWIAAFLKVAARVTVRATGAPSFTKQALDHAGITDAAKQEAFALLFNQHRAMTPELVAALRKERTFAPAEIANLQASYQLADLTRGDFPLVKAIKDAFGVGKPTQIRGLARKSEKDWIEFAKRTPSSSDVEILGKALERQFREAFPTAAFAGGLGRALSNGGARGLRHAAAWRAFLDQHDDFELLTTPVDAFLDHSVHPNQKVVTHDPAFRAEVKAAQRVFKLAPTFEATDALLADGLHSAQKIYRQGEGEFVQRYAGTPGFTAGSASKAWNQAAATHTAALTVIGELTSLDAESLPSALKTSGPSVKTFPNWNSLFQSGDLCGCDHCRSVLGPAAYFADLLMFLGDRKAANSISSVKDILFKRRPDLASLELSCENALTTLPYIDVVCEVLESAIAGGASDVPLTGFNAIPTTTTTAAKSAVVGKLVPAHLDPGAEFSLSQIDPNDPNRWVVHGDALTLLLTRTATTDFSARILRNTKASAAELRAYPAYVDAAAYGPLRAARYPFSLPFDLFAEEVRAAFGKCKLQRWDLMRTLRGSTAPNNPTDGDIACEFFGIGVDPLNAIDEKQLILSANPGGQQDIWGETTNADWLDTTFASTLLLSPPPGPRLALVKTFLRKTGLEYDELLALLDLPFLNLGGVIFIQHLDASCDTDKKVIQGLDTVRLDAIHRFLRLWRKLGWKMWEVDLVIRHPAIGAGVLDEPFLINLFDFARLRSRLGDKTSVEQVCALCGDLDFETHFTKPYEKRDDGLYQDLFLNKRLIQPLDHAFDVGALTGTTAQKTSSQQNLPKISSHLPTLLAALRVSEADLTVFQGLTRASNGSHYVTGDLTLLDISFLWRHTWLSKQLKLKPKEWATVLNLLQRDVSQFATPRAALELVETIDLLKATGFTPDELDWLLAANRAAKAAVKEADAARFLTGLRKGLQALRTEFDPAQYPFLQTPSDEASLAALLTSLVQRLGRDESSTQFFVDTVREQVVQEQLVPGLPAGFTFPATITGAPNNIPISYAPTLRFTGVMTLAQKTILQTHPSLSAVTGLSVYQKAIDALFDTPGQPVKVELPASFTFPGAITGGKNRIPIRYDPLLRLSGRLTDGQRLMLRNNVPAAVNNTAYRDALDAFHFHDDALLAVKFFEPVFTTPLDRLPAAVDFKALADPALARKVAYDPETRVLRVAGILTADDQQALNALSNDTPYRGAVQSLFDQPRAATFPPGRLWLHDVDLQGLVPDRLATAAKRALSYLGTTLSDGLVVQQAAAQLGLTEALARYLLTRYPILASSPNTLLAHLTGPFAATTGALDHATATPTFDGWFWATRAALLLKKWKIEPADWPRLAGLTSGARLLDLQSLPLDTTGTIAPIERFLRTSRLLRVKESLPETDVAFLDVLEKLNGASAYSAVQFAADVQGLNDAWSATDVADLVTILDLTYPADYRLAETWERLRRAFYFLDSLNAGAARVKAFAAATMGPAETRTLKELLRSKFGPESWLSLSTDIQDALREKKRDALAAYLLSGPKPPDAPSGSWETTNDLYAYYLLDVEMSSCMLTSRIVVSLAAPQLFVQRCLMGLEPDVKVDADGATGDSAWRWWSWMGKFRVWEANRKVFLWPENWIEPELKPDRSAFFKDLENELLQNEITQDKAEAAFENYLEKLDGVGQLEIAGFCQQDDGDNAIVHVFGRTGGAEPQIYYYRRYDYRQWTPWEKVELDIQGDYVIPAVVANRLLLFWPVLTDVPDDANNSTVTTPTAGTSVALQKASKTLRLQLAVAEYRQGQWTPKRISKDFADSVPYRDTFTKQYYRFSFVDATDIDGRVYIVYTGSSAGSSSSQPAPPATLEGAFEIADCGGVPTIGTFRFHLADALWPDSAGPSTTFMKWVEVPNRSAPPNGAGDDFTLHVFGGKGPHDYSSTPVLAQSPDRYRMSPPSDLSYLDRLLLYAQQVVNPAAAERTAPIGSWVPYFYRDRTRTFFCLPCLAHPSDGPAAPPVSGPPRYYPEIKRQFREREILAEGQVQASVAGLTLPAPGTPARQSLEQSLFMKFPEQAPPYTDDQVTELQVRQGMLAQRAELGMDALNMFQLRRFDFRNFYHHFVCDYTKLVADPLQGIPGLMRRQIQLADSGFSFKWTYQPTAWVVDPATEKFYPREIVDFSPDGAYSSYNWELFFHAPLLIANALSRNQRFEEARQWYHFIFNPIGIESAAPGGSAMSKYWITQPFFMATDPQYVQARIDNILGMLNGNPDLERQVRDSRDHPFDPHRIANYRVVAYQKTVVMKYLDNLIAWGDFLFRQDSMESINEATQLYVLAAEILGPRPKNVPPQAKPPLRTFAELEATLDDFSNALVQVENLIPPLSGGGTGASNAPPLPMFYFCIPQNDKMLGYWDTVADRLFKIRHCMNIEGVVRQLALFEPPIDPALLVKATAAGVDVGSALADLNAPLPLYRFTTLLQKANEVCNDVKALGGALLGALEKKDAEALSLLRQSQEINLLAATRAVRQKQIEEANANLEGIKKSRVVAETRRNYYRDIERLSSEEKLHLDKLTESNKKSQLAQKIKIGASIISLLPAIDLGASGFGGTPLIKFKLGGLELGQAASLASDVISFLAQVAANDATMASINAGNDRRWDEWKQQEKLADRELDQFDAQIAAAELRVTIAETELANHLIQIDNAKAVDAFMRSKYTNLELYQWQIGQIADVYFRSYQLAYDLARRAERCFRFELGLQDSSYVSFGYWDSLKKGLFSGERLQHDLRRLESAYLEQNRREREMAKPVSLRLLDPLALIQLRETGRCFFQLPEELFDLDYPGHYFRRVKTVSLTVPCVTGPYTTIACTLRLLKSSLRINTAEGDQGYARNTDENGLPADDSRFVENNIPVKAIAASSGQNDSGMFELNFRDDRYLPFEGAGAISEWSLELFNDSTSPDFGKSLRQFDYGTIADAILHVKYTAREDAGPFKAGAVQHLREYFIADDATPSLLLLNLREQFPTQWSRFLNPSDPKNGKNVFQLEMSPDLFRTLDAGKTLKIHRIWLLARGPGNYSALMAPVPLPATAVTLVQSTEYGELWSAALASQTIEIDPAASPVTWTITMTGSGTPLDVKDMFLVLGYEWGSTS